MAQSSQQFKENLSHSFAGPSLAVVIPCLNEKDSIPWVLQKMVALSQSASFMSMLSSFEVLVVDDGSADGGMEVVRKFVDRHGFIRLIKNEDQSGYGAAIKCGLRNTQSELFCFLDMDQTYDPLDLEPMLQVLLQNDLDMIYGARMHGNSRMPGVRTFGNLFYARLVRSFFKTQLSDVCTGMRIFKKEKRPAVLNINENGLDFSIALTMLSILQKWKVSEVEVSYYDRKGLSKLSVIRDGLSFLYVILNSWMLRSRS